MIHYLADATAKAVIGSLVLVAILEAVQWACIYRHRR